MAGTTPDVITFAAVSDASLLTEYTSNTVTITGLDDPSPISISGGGATYSVNSAAFTNTPGTVSLNDTVAVKLTSSTYSFIQTVGNLSVGGVVSPYVVTTLINSDYFYDLLGLTSSIIPASVVEGFIASWKIVHPTSDCQVIYHTIISIYTWLVQSSAATAVNGSRREKNSRREIEVRNSDSASTWQNALDNFVKNPWNLIPVCQTELTGGSSSSRIIIGGTKKSEINRVRDNPDSYGQYEEKSPYSTTTKFLGGPVKGFRLR